MPRAPVGQDRLKLWHTCQAVLTRSGAGSRTTELLQRRWHGEGQALALREGEGFFTVARGTGTRERWRARGMARDRPSPYGEGKAFFSSEREGQAPATLGDL